MKSTRSFPACLLLLALAGAGPAPHARAADPAASKASATPGSPTPSIADPGFLRDFAQTFRYRLGLPNSFRLSPDGATVYFLRSGPRSFVQDLYAFDAATGQERLLLTADQVVGGGEEQLTPEERARRERQRLASRGIASFELSKDGKKLLVPLSGRLFVIDAAGAPAGGSIAQSELVSNSGFPIDPRFSPDGSLVACVRVGDLFVMDATTGAEQRLTMAEGEHIEHGAAEFVAQEEMDRREGYWWSPDSTRLVYQRTDTSGVERFHIADPVNPQNSPQEWPYPRAGRDNAEVSLGIVSVRGGPSVWVQWDRQAYPYLARVDWSDADAPLTILVQNRTQTEQVLLEVDPTSGVTKPLFTERDDAWINLHSGPEWLDDGSAFVWHADAGSDPALQLRARDGSLLHTITPPGLLVQQLVGVDSAAGRAFFTASGGPELAGVQDIDPTVAFAMSASILPPGAALPAGRQRFDRLPQRGVTGLVASPKFDSFVVTSERFDAPPAFELQRAGDQNAARIRSVAEVPPFFPNVEFAPVRGPDSGLTFQTALIRPRNFKPGALYPVILSVYGGPGLQYVTLNPRGALLDQWYADHGFIVVRIDGRGTPGRGRAWERAIKDNLIDLPLNDQAEALRALARAHPELDLSRVGVYGWSFGGYFSAMAAMRRPDLFAAGVAGAPVCDWADYDTHYTERFLGTPQTNQAGYRVSNVLTYTKDLRVPLFVVHGTADDNVYFMHSLKMTDSLFRAGRPFDFLALPGFTHMVPDPDVTSSLYSRIADFFVEHVQQKPRLEP